MLVLSKVVMLVVGRLTPMDTRNYLLQLQQLESVLQMLA
jgi:hypothetical protein